MDTLKKCIIIACVLLLILSACKGPLRTKKPERPTKVEMVLPATEGSKPHVMIISSTGGGGQMSASLAIQSYLRNDYHTSIVQVITEVWGDLDPVKFCSAHKMSGEDLYNFFLRNGLNWSGAMWCCIGTWFSSLFETQLMHRLEQFLTENRPDAIISVVPFINGVIYKVAEKLNIPFSIVCVDLDVSTYLNGIYEPVYDKFYCAIPFEDQTIRSLLQNAHLPEKMVQIVGFPVREEFLHMHDRTELRSMFGFPHDRPIVMVLMGAAGSRSILGYARKLAKMKVPMHLILCIGRNELLRDYLQTIDFPSHISVTIFGFTDKIAQLMQVSDLLITKSGSVTVCEAFYAQVPILLDYTATVLTWERLNIDFVRDHGFGDAITSLHRVPWHVNQLLTSQEKRDNMRTALQQFVLPDVKNNIHRLVNNMLAHACLITHGTTLSDETIPLHDAEL